MSDTHQINLHVPFTCYRLNSRRGIPSLASRADYAQVQGDVPLLGFEIGIEPVVVRPHFLVALLAATLFAFGQDLGGTEHWVDTEGPRYRFRTGGYA